MKGIKDLYLHPDNLIAGRLYRVKFKGIVNPDIKQIREGKFVKMSQQETETGKNKLAVQFRFGREKDATAIAWERIEFISELTMRTDGGDE